MQSALGAGIIAVPSAEWFSRSAVSPTSENRRKTPRALSDLLPPEREREVRRRRHLFLSVSSLICTVRMNKRTGGRKRSSVGFLYPLSKCTLGHASRCAVHGSVCAAVRPLNCASGRGRAETA